ncbi:hypothetical protein CYMTET_44317 [Cymbomonas tetramitiformis]|uniref:Uncharacterized protein n=1 Tax=Cymbomonas tetramitiformis TaxID=36881 RepID=A0AAE0EZ44_9CHLO|nr:hypothetical protein CYMTET_44317 [Cymbomonas tetramitiformis]|eukprot:gene833-1310_t
MSLLRLQPSEPSLQSADTCTDDGGAYERATMDCWEFHCDDLPAFDSVEQAMLEYKFGALPTNRQLRSGVEFLVNNTRLLLQQSSGPRLRGAAEAGKADTKDAEEFRYQVIVQQIEVAPNMQRKGLCTDVMRAIVKAAAKRDLDVMVQCVHNEHLEKLLRERFGAVENKYASGNHVIRT